jgi:Porin subfamily
MNIVRLSLCTGAALAAVSDASADDARGTEPASVEYVDICDAYGAGFAYIPGSKTCIRIGGYVRYEIRAAQGDRGWRKLVKASLDVTSATETELGTLISYIDVSAKLNSGEINSGNLAVKSALNLDSAWISLGGVKMGVAKSAFGSKSVHFIGYTYDSGKGFSSTVNLEEADYNTDYIPNVASKVSYQSGPFSVTGYAAYDATRDAFALKTLGTWKSAAGVSFNVLAAYNSGANFYGQWNDYGKVVTRYSDWNAGGSVTFPANEKLALTLAAQYLHVHSKDDGSNDAFYRLGAVVDYTIVKNLAAKLTIKYQGSDGFDAGKDDGFSGFLRIQRLF